MKTPLNPMLRARLHALLLIAIIAGLTFAGCAMPFGEKSTTNARTLIPRDCGSS